MIIEYTKELTDAVFDACAEAHRMRHDMIGCDDLLLGILRADDNHACQVLRSLGKQPADIHHLTEQFTLYRGSDSREELMPRSKCVEDTLQYMIQFALKYDHLCIGTEHLLFWFLVRQKPVTYWMI